MPLVWLVGVAGPREEDASREGTLGSWINKDIERRPPSNGGVSETERLEVFKDYPASPGCTSPFAPIWISEMVRRQHDK